MPPGTILVSAMANADASRVRKVSHYENLERSRVPYARRLSIRSIPAMRAAILRTRDSFPNIEVCVRMYSSSNMQTFTESSASPKDNFVVRKTI